MGIDKDGLLEAKAKLFRALGDASRLAVIETLRAGPKCVSDIVALTSLSQPNVSGHLAFLRDCGLVKREQRGRFGYYYVDAAEVEAILTSADKLVEAAKSGWTRAQVAQDESCRRA